MKKLQKLWILFTLGLLLAGCGDKKTAVKESAPTVQEEAAFGGSELTEVSESEESTGKSVRQRAKGRAKQTEDAFAEDSVEKKDEDASSKDIAEKTEGIAYIDIPVYTGEAYAVINDNVPYFSDNELTDISYEEYAELDELGRCGVCIASVGQDIMPTEKRESIGSVKPTGWQTTKYDIVDGKYLYNRCHLIGFQLTGENANKKNLITGTRYMNVDGMLPFENMVADYVKETGNHVMYRVTPLFDGDNLVADGVLMEAKSVEDDGEDILFNVFCYNVQPGISIDYATGESKIDDTAAGQTASAEKGDFAVNRTNGKIHIAGKCFATGDTDSAMSDPAYFDTYEEAEAYSVQIAPNEKKRKCGNCW